MIEQSQYDSLMHALIFSLAALAFVLAVGGIMFSSMKSTIDRLTIELEEAAAELQRGGQGTNRRLASLKVAEAGRRLLALKRGEENPGDLVGVAALLLHLSEIEDAEKARERAEARPC